MGLNDKMLPTAPWAGQGCLAAGRKKTELVYCLFIDIQASYRITAPPPPCGWLWVEAHMGHLWKHVCAHMHAVCNCSDRCLTNFSATNMRGRQRRVSKLPMRRIGIRISTAGLPTLPISPPCISPASPISLFSLFHRSPLYPCPFCFLKNTHFLFFLHFLPPNMSILFILIQGSFPPPSKLSIARKQTLGL